jgi:two-component system, OmpR family, sensor histidine kinase KdpD
MNHLARALLALVSVAVVGVVLEAAGTDRAVAALVFGAVVILMSLLGRPAAAVSAVASFLALNYLFIPTTGALTIESAEDLLPLVAFAFAGAASEQVAKRVHELRRRADQNERDALDARVDAAVNEARAGFLAAMTHNLRTPLASIKSAASTLRSPAVNARPAVRDALIDTVSEETARLERLVTKVLEMSRIHAGELHPDIERTTLADLARGALRRVRQIAAHHEIELVAEDDPVEVDVDPHMMELALVSLLENALRFAPPGSVVTVVTGRSSVATGEIRVVDHGPGIDVADRDRVFQEFVRLGDAPGRDSPGSDGSGVGLAIARAFVEAHDGSITVEETPGGGASFVVTLTLATEVADVPLLTMVEDREVAR